MPITMVIVPLSHYSNLHVIMELRAERLPLEFVELGVWTTGSFHRQSFHRQRYFKE
uniref:Uncharacterized protein n=1 Tax=Rhizophagus irregularis (strain DAOM 181602 / DAOM 197198 / MUCL 43194) TaxID=747089 RepID=U9TT22_RHIID